jgi:hypothetical protein
VLSVAYQFGNPNRPPLDGRQGVGLGAIQLVYAMAVVNWTTLETAR